MSKKRNSRVTTSTGAAKLPKIFQERFDALAGKQEAAKYFKESVVRMAAKSMSEDDLGLVLRFHMVIDNALTTYIKNKTPHGAEKYILLSDRTQFGVKVAYVVALGIPIYVAEICKQINDIRNSLAHPRRSAELEIQRSHLSALEPPARELYAHLSSKEKDDSSTLEDLRWSWVDPIPDDASSSYRAANDRTKFAMICSLCTKFFADELILWARGLVHVFVDDLKSVLGERFALIPAKILKNLNAEAVIKGDG